jgi:Response regulator containing a CheY-like receiver domain and an HTH DNA-binding domain
MLLAQQDDIQVVGEAADGLQALSLAEALQPNILLLDVQIPEVGGPEVLPKIRARSPRTKVLILSGFFEDGFIAGALEYGAIGYLLKTATNGVLVKAIRTTHAGELWAQRKVLAQVLENLRQRADEQQRPLSEMRKMLTDREYEIVKWVVQGMKNKEIATQLGISEKTVKAHLNNIFSKLNVNRRLQLLRYPTA